MESAVAHSNDEGDVERWTEAKFSENFPWKRWKLCAMSSVGIYIYRLKQRLDYL